MRPPAPHTIAPGNPHQRMHHALGSCDWPLLVRLCQQSLRKNRMDQTAHRLLGFGLNKQHKTEEALQAFALGARLYPNDAELLINYGNTLVEHVRNQEALPLLEKVCALRPNKAMGWLKVAECCYLLDLHDKGFAAALRGATLAQTEEEHSIALTQKAIHRRELGQIREAVQDCEATIALNPLIIGAHSNRILYMLADPAADALQIAQAARAYATVFEAPLKAQWPHFDNHQGAPWRRLKVGFIGSDFRMHAVMYFVEGLLAQLDRRQFEVYAYYLHPKGDHVTERVQRHADCFVNLAGTSTEEQVRRIRADGIDILIELSGHTGGNALLALAHKAAPVQVSWLGFPATTGLEAVDYKITDEVTDPANADDQYSERLYRMSTMFACYRPMSRQPLWRYQPRYLVRPAPALTNGYVTFGSCNNLGKLTDEVLHLWGRILQAVPTARLLIEGKNLGDPNFAETYRQRCANQGILTDRLELVGLHTDNQYLTYHRIDIALDPFPLTGGTTSFDTLWMGVPLVSMEGTSFKSRMGAGILTYMGRTEWLASNTDDYLRIAQELASDPERLNTLRQGLRTEVEESCLMREDLFNLHFGHALRDMWLHWLAQARHPGDAEAQTKAMEQWWAAMPDAWMTPDQPGVGLAPGKRVKLPEAHEALQQLVDRAKEKQPVAKTPDGMINNRHWAAVTELSETLLSAVPHDAVALACLAEVEFAHGHTEFAVTYLRYAQESLAHTTASPTPTHA